MIVVFTVLLLLLLVNNVIWDMREGQEGQAACDAGVTVAALSGLLFTQNTQHHDTLTLPLAFSSTAPRGCDRRHLVMVCVQMKCD